MKTMTAEQLAARLEGREPVRLIDVLSREHYDTVHLPEAENLPLDELADLAPERLGRDETVVVYCSNFDCSKSPKAAAVLEELGYQDVYDFEGGIAEWRKGGRPLVRDRDPHAA